MSGKSKLKLGDLKPLCLIIITSSENSLIIGTNINIILRIDYPYSRISESKELEIQKIECLTEGGNKKFWGSGPDELGDITIILFSSDLKTLKKLKGHSDSVIGMCFISSYLYSASQDNTVIVWSETSSKGTTLYTHDSSIIAFDMKKTSEIVATSDNEKNLKVFSINENKILLQSNLEEKVWSLKFFPLKDLIICGNHNGSIIVINYVEKEKKFSSNAHESRIKSIWINGDFIITGSFDQRVCIWNAEDYERVENFEDHDDWVRGVCSSDKYVFSVSDDNSLVVNEFIFTKNIPSWVVILITLLLSGIFYNILNYS